MALASDLTCVCWLCGVLFPPCSVGSLTYRGQRRQFTPPGEAGKVALEMYTSLTDIQTEKVDDANNWIMPVA